MLTGVSVHNDVCPVHEAIWQSLEDCTKTLSGESKSWDGDDCIEGQIKLYWKSFMDDDFSHVWSLFI